MKRMKEQHTEVFHLENASGNLVGVASVDMRKSDDLIMESL